MGGDFDFILQPIIKSILKFFIHSTGILTYVIKVIEVEMHCLKYAAPKLCWEIYVSIF